MLPVGIHNSSRRESTLHPPALHPGGCSLPPDLVQAQLSPARDPGSIWGQLWMRGDSPLSIHLLLSCKNTFAQHRYGHEPAAAEAANRPGQAFTTNTSHRAGRGQTRTDRPDSGHEEHKAPLPWGRLAGTVHGTALLAHRQPCPSRRQTPKKGAAQAVCRVGTGSDRPTGGTGRGKVEFTLRANSRSPSANTLALAPGLCLGPSTAIGLGSRSKSWKRPAAARTGNLSSGSKMEVGRNGLRNPSSPSSSSPKAWLALQRAGVSNHLPQRGFLSAWEKPQLLSRVLERGFITSWGARVDKVWRHAKKPATNKCAKGTVLQHPKAPPCPFPWATRRVKCTQS